MMICAVLVCVGMPNDSGSAVVDVEGALVGIHTDLVYHEDVSNKHSGGSEAQVQPCSTFLLSWRLF